MNKEIKILEISACCNKQAEQKLFFKGSSGDRMYLFINEILQKESYDVLSIREISWNALKKVKHLLMLHGYKFYIHEDWNSVKVSNRWRYTCLSAVFVKENIEFKQLYTSDNFDTTLRYVLGEIKFENYCIYWKTSHIPCVDDEVSRAEYQINRKKLMLLDEIQFQKNMVNNLVLSTGDFNGGAEGDYHCCDLYNQFVFEDLIKEATYEDKCLDHVFVSKNLIDNKDVKVEAKVLNEFYMKFTDHKLISISLSNNEYQH